MRRLVCVAATLRLGGAAVGGGNIINVPGDYPTIQAAVNAAQDADEILVAPGTYLEAVYIMGKSIAVRSSDGPAVTTVHNIGGGDMQLEAASVSLEGFTLTGSGGAEVTQLSNLEMTNCVLSGLSIGVLIDGSTAVLTECVFTASSLYAVGASASTVDIRGCSFLQNRGGYAPVALLNESAVTVAGSAFVGNTGQWSGAVYNEADAAVTGCMFVGNSGAAGGAIHDAGVTRVTDSLLVANDATFGGAFFVASGTLFQLRTLDVANCTIVDNTAGNGGAGFLDEFAGLGLRNSILRANSPNQVVADPLAVAEITHSNVQGGWPGLGNIDSDPLFVDPASGDYRLLPGSPCIDAGHNWAVPQDTADLDGDRDTAELAPFDLDSLPRFVDDPSTPDTGCGLPKVVDMGAYEFQFDDPVGEVVYGDLEGNGSVGITDLLELLAAWGDAGDQCNLADLDLDGEVGITDLLALLANWG